jgi:hypothetical protein
MTGPRQPAAAHQGELKMTNIEHARAEIVRTLEKNAARIEAAIATSKGGFVYAWADYGLGVLIASDGPRVVSVECATVIRKPDARTFTNGAKRPAEIIERNAALAAALAMVRANIARIAAM